MREKMRSHSFQPHGIKVGLPAAGDSPLPSISTFRILPFWFNPSPEQVELCICWKLTRFEYLIIQTAKRFCNSTSN